MTGRLAQRAMSDLRRESRAPPLRRSVPPQLDVDALFAAQHLRKRSKLTWIVTMKGKGTGPSYHTRSRSSLLGGRPVVTRLTRTMGFVEVSQSPSVPGSMSTPGDDAPELPEIESPPR